MNIIKTQGTIVGIQDLSKTAKEVQIALNTSLVFNAGSFVNLFMEINGEKVRRAFSISSSDTDSNTITLSIRLTPAGKMTPLFWSTNLIGKQIELMGPLGLNTVNTMTHSNIYLFGFGIGAGVIKSIAEHFSTKKHIESLTIVTGSRTEDEIIYKNYFDELSKTNPNIHASYVISSLTENSSFKKGYIQDYLDEFDFNESDVYVCGQETACNQLVQKIKSTNPNTCNFLIEGFH